MTPSLHQQGTPHAQRLSEPPNLQGQSRWGWRVTGHGLGMSRLRVFLRGKASVGSFEGLGRAAQGSPGVQAQWGLGCSRRAVSQTRDEAVQRTHLVHRQFCQGWSFLHIPCKPYHGKGFGVFCGLPFSPGPLPSGSFSETTHCPGGMA